jgi:CubicO group peptidase (beta-lactamase class C family)
MPATHPIEAPLLQAVDSGQLAGAAALVWRDGAIRHVVTAGRRDLVSDAPVERDTMFRIASASKPVTTACALTLLDEGRFELDQPITSCAPELAHLRVLRDPEGPLEATLEAARAITFRDLLTHRSGLTYGDLHRGPIGQAHAEVLGPTVDNRLTPSEWVARLGTLPLVDQPGAGFHYGLSTDLLGFLVARLDDAPLGAVLKRRVLSPLGMRDTGFTVPAEARHRRAGLCGFDADGRLAPLTETPGGHALDERPDGMTFDSGGQGLWSTLDDYLAFARMLIGDGPGADLLRPETRARMVSNQLTPAQRAGARMFGQALFAGGHGYGMGIAVVTEPETADPLRGRGGAGTISWPGAWGTWWQADPTNGSVLIFLTHNMVGVDQMARGIGLGVWSTIASFHQIATS